MSWFHWTSIWHNNFKGRKCQKWNELGSVATVLMMYSSIMGYRVVSGTLKLTQHWQPVFFAAVGSSYGILWYNLHWTDLPSRFAKLLDETLVVSPKSWEQAGSSSYNKGTVNHKLLHHCKAYQCSGPHSCKFNVHGHCQCLESCLRSHP